MAAAREGDILLWLHNKLGTSADTWSEGSICSQLNVEALRNIKDCFVELQTQVKLKLLLSFFHIPKRNVEEWRGELEDILEVAIGDSEPWVTMLAEIMKIYPTNGSLNLDIREPAENQRMTHDLVIEMKKLVKKHSELGLLPMECNYLNRNAFLAAAGQQVPLTKHFALKRKPKAAALRAELLNRSGDAQANVKKNQLPSVPVRSRGAPRKTDTTPMRGIPNRISSTGLRTSGLNASFLTRPLGRSNLNRKDGGIKLLEITESPIAIQQSKKRRKVHEADNKSADSEKQKEQTSDKVKDDATSNQQNESTSQMTQQTTTVEPSTPDYAAGLTPSNPPTPSPATPIITVTNAGTQIHGNTVTLGTLTVRSPLTSVAVASDRGTASLAGTAVATLTPQRIIVANAQGGPGTPTILYRAVNAPSGYAHTELLQATPVSITPGEVSVSSGQPQYATLQPVQPDLIYTGVNIAQAVGPGGQTQMFAVAPSQVQLTTQQPTSQAQQQAQIIPLQHSPNTQQIPAQQQQQKRGLSLTKEQMIEAQEMFRTSNKVTRPEKALILGFMAGSRDNPCPHLGNIVTIKLSEREEMVNQPEGSMVKMLAETHFQMNYNTGEWKRIRKYRPLQPVE